MRLLLYGAGGLGRGTYDLIKKKNEGHWDSFLFVDDVVSDPDFYGVGCVLFDSGDPRLDPAECEVIVTVGEPFDRNKIQKKLEDKGYRFATYIDRDSWIATDVKIEEGAVVFANCYIDVNVTLKKNTMIQHHVIIGHDTVVGEGSVISSSSVIGGNVDIGKDVFIGLSGVIKQGLTIEDRAIISMGSVVYRDVEEEQVLTGNPARVTKGKENGRVFA